MNLYIVINPNAARQTKLGGDFSLREMISIGALHLINSAERSINKLRSHKAIQFSTTSSSLSNTINFPTIWNKCSK